MSTFLLILISIAIIFLLILLWVRLVNSFMSSTFRQPEFEKYYSKKKSDSPNIQHSKPKQIVNPGGSHPLIEQSSILSDGVFQGSDLPKMYQDRWDIYFEE